MAFDHELGVGRDEEVVAERRRGNESQRAAGDRARCLPVIQAPARLAAEHVLRMVADHERGRHRLGDRLVLLVVAEVVSGAVHEHAQLARPCDPAALDRGVLDAA
jgi:hypothetical protein